MDEASLGGIVAYYDELHQRILSELADIDAAELDAPSLWWEGYGMPVRFRLHRFSSHLRQHTIQIEKTLAALGHSPSEVQRLWRLLYGALAEAEGVTIGAWELGIEQRREVAAQITRWAGEIADVVAQ